MKTYFVLLETTLSLNISDKGRITKASNVLREINSDPREFSLMQVYTELNPREELNDYYEMNKIFKMIGSDIEIFNGGEKIAKIIQTQETTA
jgi:hypothetical protein